jgi:hypothetical protein
MFTKLAAFLVLGLGRPRPPGANVGRCAGDWRQRGYIANSRRTGRPTLICRWQRAPAGALECRWQSADGDDHARGPGSACDDAEHALARAA